MVEPLVNGQPGPDETWPELAEHSFTHDDVARPGWAAAGRVGEWHLPLTREDILAHLEQVAALVRARTDYIERRDLEHEAALRQVPPISL